jgi:NAD(P)-dependent dehydrogenase (short-subunit alcohol dehydrogenase family)
MSNKDAVPAVADLLSLNGQRALVTGGSGNIGRGIALRLAEAGADIVVQYHSDEDGAAATVDAVTAIGGNTESLQADLTIADEVAGMFAGFDKSNAPITCVVNNAGGYRGSR